MSCARRSPPSAASWKWRCSRPRTPEQYRDAMVNALEDVEKLSSIVRALLLLSQAESGQLVAAKDAARSGRSGGRPGGSVPDSGRGKGRQSDRFAGARRCRSTSADRTQIERLLSNLLSNAVKYTPKGGTVHVRVGAGIAKTGWTTPRSGGHRRRHSGRKSAAYFRPFLSRAQRADQQHRKASAWA